MKGVVFQVFEAFICDTFGDEAYEMLLDQCPLHSGGVFVEPGTYPDSDLLLMVTKTCERFGVEPPDALRAFGKFMFPMLVAKAPAFAEGHTAKTFLMSIHDVIHVEVRKLYPEAVTPSFTYEDPGEGALVMHYTSHRRLCHLLEGLLDGVAEHFGETLERDHATCMHDGAQACTFRLRIRVPEGV